MADRQHTFKAGRETAGMRLDAFLAGQEVFSSRSEAQNLISKNQIFVNGKNVKASYKINENDEITAVFGSGSPVIIKGENLPLDIVYEDKSILVVNKPKNMLSHPTEKETSGTLVNALLYKYGYEGLSDINGLMRPGILHRLDRNTSGLLMIAKTNAAHEFLTEQIKTKTASRQYLAVVQGNFENETGSINLPLARSIKNPEKITVSETGKPSATNYRVIEEFKGYTLLELTLLTGRTHQIRVHMSYTGHPVVNDSLYNKSKFKVKTAEQVLQAYKLKFTALDSNDIINLEIKPDDDISRVLKYLRNLK